MEALPPDFEKMSEAERMGVIIAKLEVLKERALKLDSYLEQTCTALVKIKDWADAYPIDVFPDLTDEQVDEARLCLKEAGKPSLSLLYANWARHILDGIRTHCEEGLKLHE